MRDKIKPALTSDQLFLWAMMIFNTVLGVSEIEDQRPLWAMVHLVLVVALIVVGVIRYRTEKAFIQSQRMVASQFAELGRDE